MSEMNVGDELQKELQERFDRLGEYLALLKSADKGYENFVTRSIVEIQHIANVKMAQVYGKKEKNEDEISRN